MRNEEGDAQRKKTKYGHVLLKSSNVQKTTEKNIKFSRTKITWVTSMVAFKMLQLVILERGGWKGRLWGGSGKREKLHKITENITGAV